MSCDLKITRVVMCVANKVQTPRWPSNSLDLNPIDGLLDLLKRKLSAQPNHVIHQMFAAIPQ